VRRAYEIEGVVRRTNVPVMSADGEQLGDQCHGALAEGAQPETQLAAERRQHEAVGTLNALRKWGEGNEGNGEGRGWRTGR
jgi:hypothetical protein